MNNAGSLPDAEARLTAETTFDRNVVVLAGAGTGKTTLLVNRLVHSLLREPHPLRLTDMLALTFTNKAANEMKIRLRNRLHELLGECEGERHGGDSARKFLEEIRQRAYLSTEQIQERIRTALDDLEKAQIATLHSFAAHLLRLYPLESRVDPNFQEDEGNHFFEMFEEMWTIWLEEELGPLGSAHGQWQEILHAMTLKDLRAFAFALCQDLISLRVLEQQFSPEGPAPAFRTWLHEKHRQIRTLLQRYERVKPRKIEKLLALAGEVFDQIGQVGRLHPVSLPEAEAALFEAPIGKAPAEWDPADFQHAKRAVHAAHRLLRVNEPLLHTVIQLLGPFVERARQNFSDKGWIRFDGLLIRVRDLLRDYPLVREQLKGVYQAILVDEFQDTDPVQYEILLYLGERPGEHRRMWRDIRLVPGKLFIVGDPKQSIYAFRRADIEAFDQVVEKVIREDGIVCTLLTNFRSDGVILDTVNAVFDRLFLPEPNVQPPNIPLAVGRVGERIGEAPGVEAFVMANQEGEEWDASRATRMEAEWLAGWIKGQLWPDTHTIVEKGVRRPLCPGHIAVLFKTFTNAHIYLEAFQRHQIPCVTDGERHFYRRQEVVDLINVLRVIDDPSDHIALVGMLRSSLGGLTDQEIMDINTLGQLDISRPFLLDTWDHPHRPAIQQVFQRLDWLHAHANRLPLAELLDQVFLQLPIMELAAASSHGEQAVVNVWKLRDLMSTQAAVPHLTFSAWVDRLVEALLAHPAEPEAPLAEDSLAAVRVLTIHKAKGLEFPVVILPGLHQKGAKMDRGADVVFDWVSGLYGCSLPPVWNAGQIPLWEKQQIREEAELRRVLYVGMTRARDRLILSGGLLPKRVGDTFFGLLQAMVEGEFGNPEYPAVRVGTVSIPQTVITPEWLRSVKADIPPSAPKESVEVVTSLLTWRARAERWQQIHQVAACVTPSLLHQETPTSNPERRPLSQSMSQRVGILLHRLLQWWDFQHEPENFREDLARFCQRHLLSEPETDKKTIIEELETLFSQFLHSPAYQELQQSRIIGREVSFAIPWPTPHPGQALPRTCVMEGMMDVIYECDGDVWVGDYKTDQVPVADVPRRAEAYREQAFAYATAARQCLGPAFKGCKLFFIRPGEVVQLDWQK